MRREPITLAIVLVLLLPSVAIMIGISTQGLDDASGNIVFEGNGSFTGSSSVFVRGGSGTDSDPYIVSDQNMSVYNIQIKNTTDHVIVRNMTFSSSSSWAIYLYNARNVVIDNITCEGRSSFIYSYGCQDLILTDSNISDIRYSDKVMDIVDGTDITIQDSEFTENTLSGAGAVEFDDQGSGHIFRRNKLRGVDYIDRGFYDDGEISNSTFLDGKVTIQNGNTGARICDNVFDNEYGDAVDISYSYRLRILRNHFHAPDGNGIYFNNIAYQAGGDIQEIANNTFESCDKGISTPSDYTTRLTWNHIHHNYFGNCTGYALELNNAYYSKIWRNIFYHNAGTDNSSSGSQAQENTIYQSAYRNKWTVGGQGNFWANHRTPDADNDGIVDINYTITTNGLDTAPFTNPYFDTERPYVKLLAPRGDYSQSSYIRVKWEANDAHSGIEEVMLSINGNDWMDVTEKDIHSIYLTKGVHDVAVKVYDRARLFNISQNSFQINRTRPIMEIEHPVQDAYYKQFLQTIEWDIVDYFHPQNITMSIDGDETQLPTGSRLLTKSFEEGVHVVEITLIDDDGLSFSRSVEFTVDLTPPMVEMISPLPDAVLSNPLVNFNYRVDDNFGIGRVEVNLNGEGWVDRTAVTSFSELLEKGQNSIFVKATDLAGTVTNMTMNFWIGGDTGIEILAPANGTVTRNASLDLVWEYNGDFDWNISLLKVGRSGIFEDIGGARTWNIDLPSDGNYEVTLRLEDRFGNYIQESVYIRRDLRPPNVGFLYPRNGDYLNKSSVNITWSGVDTSGISISNYQLRIDNGSWMDMGTREWYSSQFQDGPHILYLKGSDLAGNIGERSIEFTVDTLAPQIIFISPKDGEMISDSSTEFRWKASDKSGLTELTLIIDGSIIIEVLSISSSTKTTTIGSDGYHDVWLVGRDEAGNVANVSMELLVDTASPVVKWNIEPSGYWNRSWYNISWSIQERWGISNITLYLDNNEDPRYLDTSSTHVNMTLPEGEYRFRLVVTDLVGWVSEMFDQGPLVIDMTPPILEVDEARSEVDGSQVTIVWDSRDKLSGLRTIYIGLDDEPPVDINVRNSYKYEGLKPGIHNVTIISEDNSGNRISAGWQFEIMPMGEEDSDGESEIPLFAWIAMVVAAFLVLFLVIGVIINRRKYRKERAISKIERPNSISVPPRSAPAPASMPVEDRGLFPSAAPRIEETEEGSGYIRPKKEKKKKKSMEIEHEEESGPDDEKEEEASETKKEPEAPLTDMYAPVDEKEEEDRGVPDIRLPEEEYRSGVGSMDMMEPPEPSREMPDSDPSVQEEQELDEVPTWDEDQEPEPWESPTEEYDEDMVEIEDFEELEEIDEVEELDDWEE
ncbi:MAG: right-handed parallel beta-helix repeat-containing protein [Thermoplasmatota archaeon]